MAKTKESIDILKKAQELDSQIYSFTVQLEDIPEQHQKIKSALEAEKTRYDEFQASLKKAQLLQKNKEGELAQKESNVKKLDGQLSQVKTNKEYAALQQEIASLKADNSLIEEEVLRIFDEIEAIQEESKKEQERLKLCEKEFQTKERDLIQLQKSLQDNKAQLLKQKEEILARLLPEVRDLYERIVAKKHGLALVKIQGEICGACQIRLRPQVINEVYLGERLIICDNCSRIIYAEDQISEGNQESSPA